MRVTLLGCGGSAGVPQLGGPGGSGEWGECDPAEPRNRRSRTSALVEDAAGRRLLIDAGPDLRQQFLSCGIATIDAVAFTHAHADHVLGIDDLRSVNRLRGTALDAFGTEETLALLAQRFDYAFRPPTPPGFYRPALTPRPVLVGETVAMAGMPVQVLRQDHRVMETLAFRIGRFAYSTDVVAMPEESLAGLEGLDTWVVGCFQRRPHPVHAHVAQVLDWVARMRPRRTVLTHMGIDLDYAALREALPAGVEPAHDGMVLEVAEG
ncbi:MBL fold metallo-hydrolase [Falsiroseomonas selenitidurans]|uniref:MBL fold metallo-hydrolase n=1 Tax=Falsiroseomonas selenitidurans TaxID=2716335 RepID=A0ABX1E334_9PROT|nr:MBL fold metallo-hydrolase [Falsiroseomonas selenitidurans]NKC31496.1 MBL fold metallo-hydrolase [Falsiroseomonas selenitidurans]